MTKVSNGAKIRNRYNQVPHLTQDTNGKTNSATVYVPMFSNTRTQQMRVVPKEKVFGSGLCGFLHVCIHFKLNIKDLNIEMCKMQVNRHTKQTYLCQCHVMSPK